MARGPAANERAGRLARKAIRIEALAATLLIAFAAPSALAAERPLVMTPSSLTFAPGQDVVKLALRLYNPNDEPVAGELSLGAPRVADRLFGNRSEASFRVPPRSGVAGTAGAVDIPPDSEVVVDAVVHRPWWHGESRADLLVNGVPVGELRLSSWQVPTSISLIPLIREGDDPAPFVIRRGETVRLPLRSVHPVPYEVAWAVALDGTAATGAIRFDRPGGLAEITFEPPAQWFEGGWQSLLHSRVERGTLELRYAGAAEAPGAPPIRFEAEIHDFSAGTAPFVYAAATFALLLLGASASTLFSNVFPNMKRHTRLDDAIRRLAERIGGISRKIDSRARVSLAVECNRLGARLAEVRAVWPSAPDAYAELEARHARLRRKVELLVEAEHVLGSLVEAGRREVPVSVVTPVESDTLMAIERLGEEQLDAAALDDIEKSLHEAARKLEAGRNLASDFDASLAERARNLKPELDELMSVNEHREWSQNLRRRLPGAVSVLERQAADDRLPVPSQRYFEVDAQLARVELLVQYMRCYLGMDEQGRKYLLDKQDDLLRTLSRQNNASLFGARGLLREMRELRFASDLEKRLPMYSPTIRPYAPVVRIGSPITLRVSFASRQLDRCAARDKIACMWHMQHNGREFREEGWEIQHFFLRAGEHTVQVRFSDMHGKFIRKDGADFCIERVVRVLPAAQRPRTTKRFWTEVGHFGMAQLLALGALMAGATDQLQKLDPFAGVIAVLALGFGSNVLKKAVTAAPEPTPTRTPEASADAAG